MTILIVLLVVLFLGGGGYYYCNDWRGGNGPGFGWGGGLIGLILLVRLVLAWLFGAIGGGPHIRW